MKSILGLPLALLGAALPAFTSAMQYSGTNFLGGSGGLIGIANLNDCTGALLADGVPAPTTAPRVTSISGNGTAQTVLIYNGRSTVALFFAGNYPNGVRDSITGIQFNPPATLRFPTYPTNGLPEYDIAMTTLAIPLPADVTRYNLDLLGYGAANTGARIVSHPVHNTDLTEPNHTIGSPPRTPIELLGATPSDTDDPSHSPGLGNIEFQYRNGYAGRKSAGDLTGVATLGDGSVALLADSIPVLAAAHGVTDISVDGSTPAVPSGNGLSGAGDLITGVRFNPLPTLMFPANPSNGLLEYDIAMIPSATLASADATRYDVNLSGYGPDDPVPVTVGGWGWDGNPGNPSGGITPTNPVAGVFISSSNSKLPAAQRTISLPDPPIDLQWATTSNITPPSNHTELGYGGDSGGPLLYNGNFIGILAFGDRSEEHTAEL